MVLGELVACLRGRHCEGIGKRLHDIVDTEWTSHWSVDGTILDGGDVKYVLMDSLEAIG